MARALSSKGWFFFFGKSMSIFLKSPVGSCFLSFFPLRLSQFITFSTSWVLFSGLLYLTPTDSILSKSGIASSKFDTSYPLEKSRNFSICRARSLAFWPLFFGKAASSFLKHPYGSMIASFTPWCRIQFRVSCKSFCLCSGVRVETGIAPKSLYLSMISSSSGDALFERKKSKVPSIRRALSSIVWPRFLGRSLSNLRKSPVGSYFLLFPFPFLIQLIALLRSASRCSGLLLETPDRGNLLKPWTSSPSQNFVLPSPRIQSKAPSISFARSSKVWLRFWGRMQSSLQKSPVES